MYTRVDGTQLEDTGRGSGIVDMIGSLLARNARKAMLTTAAMRGTFDAAKKAVPPLIAHKVTSTIAAAGKKQEKVEIDMKHSQEPQLKIQVVLI